MAIEMRSATLEEFIPLFQEYYGQLTYESYHRSDDAWASVAKWREKAYLFVENEKTIGGVLLPEGIVTGLFTIPPYDKYHELLNFLLDNLNGEKSVFYEVPEIYSHHYGDDFLLERTEVMMYMKPCSQDIRLSENYTSGKLVLSDVDEIGRMFHKAFSSCDVYKSVGTLEEFTSSVRSFFDYSEGNPTLYNATKVVRDEEGRIIGALLSMMDDNMPFAYNLAVDPLHQSKGIGRYLLASFVDGIKDDYMKIRLFVHTNNPARFMYESIGFKYGSVIKTYTNKICK